MSKANLTKGHVHFGAENTTSQDNSILVQQSSTGSINIHLGFLQFQHNYKISIKIPKAYFLGYDMETLLVAAEKGMPNVNCKLVSFDELSDHYAITVEFFARKEKLLKEDLTLSIDDENTIKIIFNARVLGPGKGTPLLKDGIKCTGVDIDDMSEASDWQGFD